MIVGPYISRLVFSSGDPGNPGNVPFPLCHPFDRFENRPRRRRARELATREAPIEMHVGAFGSVMDAHGGSWKTVPP